MRGAVSVIVAIHALLACSVASPSQPEGIALGTSFGLGVGEVARIDSEGLQIGVAGVPADSRCPRGEQCVWEGDATVSVWMQKAPGPRETLELHTSSKGPASASYLTYEVRLVRLDPYPVAGKAIPQGDYVATLEVNRGSSGAPDR